MNFNVIKQAVKLVKNKFKIDFVVNNFRIEQMPNETMAYGYTMVKYARPELKMELTVTEDHVSWTEHTDLEFVIFERDLLDESLVDKVIGGNIKGYSLDMRQTLRLAFIIYNGIQYGTKHEVRYKDIEAGWHPRVVSSKMRF